VVLAGPALVGPETSVVGLWGGSGRVDQGRAGCDRGQSGVWELRIAGVGGRARRAHLADMWDTAAARRTPAYSTWHGFDPPRTGGHRIDWILTRGARPRPRPSTHMSTTDSIRPITARPGAAHAGPAAGQTVVGGLAGRQGTEMSVPRHRVCPQLTNRARGT
jgi:hypothetical protein